MTRNRAKRPLLREIRNILFVVAIGNVLSLFNLAESDWTWRTFWINCIFSAGIGYPSMKAMMFLVDILDKRLPWLEAPIKRLVVQLVSLFLFSAFMIFLGFYAWFAIYEDLSLKEMFFFILPYVKVVYIFVFLSLLIANTLLFFKNWKESVVKQEELKRAHLALQNQSLRDQLQPHFMFNSLSSLLTLIDTDPENAKQFVHKLSAVYRYVLEQRDQELVPLEEELGFLLDYVFLMRIRYGENLRVEIRGTAGTSSLLVPLSLQMLVENAIKHNEISADHPLLVRVVLEKEVVRVENELRKRDAGRSSTGTGLENLSKRLRYFTDSELRIRETDREFTVVLPLLHAQPVAP
ncbi:MAG: histidine kinase [Bacteroidales bacterium]